jgi:hypothetical protein
MSLSTQGGEQRRPNVVTVGAKAGGKPGAKTPPAGSGGGKGGSPRKPITPVKVNQGRNWGPIAVFGAVLLVAAGIIGWGAWAAFKPGSAGYPWAERAKGISGIQIFDRTKLTAGHSWDPKTYPQSPPVGGDHSFVWQQCMGNVYTSPIPNEHATHSLEHGAVWLAYRSDLPKDQVAKLAQKIANKPYTLMSPVDGLDAAVSMQAWGYQLKVQDANDARIDTFISALAENASAEAGAPCSGGNTATGTTPLTQEQAVAKNLAQAPPQ